MNDNRGSAVALVLMILAVVSLAGVALISQSRLDIRLTSSIKNYDKMFSLADGGSTLSLQTVCTKHLEIPYSPNSPNQLAIATNKAIKVPIKDDKEIHIGNYSASVILDNYSDQMPGWEITLYHPVYWIARGNGLRKPRVITTQQLESTVDASVTKISKKE